MDNTILNYLDLLRLEKPLFYLLDTFDGLIEEQITDAEWGIGRRPGGFIPVYDRVREHFGPKTNVRIIQGVVPETLSKVEPSAVSFIHIDMNCVYPEIAAAEYFWDRLLPGGFMVLDDYGHRPHFPQKKAFKSFAQRKGVSILSLPTGQGLIIK